MKAHTSTLAVLAGLLALVPLAYAKWEHDALELRSIDEALDYAHFLKRELSETHAYIRSERDAAYESVLARAASSDYTDLFARAPPYQCEASNTPTCKGCRCTTTNEHSGGYCDMPSNTVIPAPRGGGSIPNPTCHFRCKCNITAAEKKRKADDDKMKIDYVVNKTPARGAKAAGKK